jgi:putative FmdB family regulatory protein
MPLYDYDCAACGRRSEVVHGVHATGPTVCPICGNGPIRKAISAAAVHFKGSGWAKKERRVTATSAASKASGEDSSSDGGAKSADTSADPTSTSTPTTAAKPVDAGAATATD